MRLCTGKPKFLHVCGGLLFGSMRLVGGIWVVMVIWSVFCKFRNVCKNLNFANIQEFVALQKQRLENSKIEKIAF